MSILGKDVAAAVFPDTDTAEKAWGLLVEAEIPAAVITEPGTFGAEFSVSVMVERDRLEEAQEVLAPFMRKQA